MACTVAALQTSACTSGIGNIRDPIKLLQIQAQLTADLLVATSPATVVTPAAILARGCTSGITLVQDEIMLLQIIAQNGCDLTP